MQSTSMSASWLDVDALRLARAARRSAARGASGTSTEKCEPRPDFESQIDRVVEHARDALDDREAEAEAARDLGALVEPVELAGRSSRCFDCGMPSAGVVDVDAQRAAAPPAADQHAALPACI